MEKHGGVIKITQKLSVKKILIIVFMLEVFTFILGIIIFISIVIIKSIVAVLYAQLKLVIKESVGKKKNYAPSINYTIMDLRRQLSMNDDYLEYFDDID